MEFNDNTMDINQQPIQSVNDNTSPNSATISKRKRSEDEEIIDPKRQKLATEQNDQPSSSSRSDTFKDIILQDEVMIVELKNIISKNNTQNRNIKTAKKGYDSGYSKKDFTNRKLNYDDVAKDMKQEILEN